MIATPRTRAALRAGKVRLAAPAGLIALACSVSGCAVVAVADAAVTVTATAVKVGADAVGAAADVTAAGVRAVTGSGDSGKK